MLAKNSMLKHFIIISFVCFLSLGFFACSPKQDRDIPKGEANQFAIMSTTDIHGKIWDKDLLNDKDEPNNLLSGSSAVKKIKDAYDNRTVLVDNGDLYQGTPVSSNNITEQAKGNTKDPNPAAIALEHMKYDAYTLGNHEFNYDDDIMKNTYSFLQDKGIPCVCANLYFENSGKRVFDPYILKTIKVQDHDIKIAIIGLVNTDCPRWDSPENYENLIFHSPENTTCDMAYEIKKVQSEMQNARVNADFTIVAYHSGLFVKDTSKYPKTDYEKILDEEIKQPLEFGINTEQQSYRVLRNTTGINMMITGHDHSDLYSNKQFKNANGEDVLVVNGACKSLTQSIYNVNWDNTGKPKFSLNKSENLPFSDFNIDDDLKEKIKPYADKTQQHLDQTIGKIGEDWNKEKGELGSKDYYLKQTDEMDLINRAQISTVNKHLKAKYSNINNLNSKIKELYGADHTLDADHGLNADLSISSVAVTKPMHEGDFSYKDTYKLYKYDNTACCVPMKGQDIKDLLEFNTENRIQINNNEKGEKSLDLKGDKFSFPIFYGINFSYNLNNPTGSKAVIDGLLNGQPLDLNKTYIVALNNYLLGNTSNSVLARFDKEKTIWSQSVDNPNDTIQAYIAEFIKDKTDADGAVYGYAHIDKNHEVSSHWSIIY